MLGSGESQLFVFKSMRTFGEEIRKINTLFLTLSLSFKQPKPEDTCDLVLYVMQSGLKEATRCRMEKEFQNKQGSLC